MANIIRYRVKYANELVTSVISNEREGDRGFIDFA